MRFLFCYVCARQCDPMILSANDFPDESLIIKSEFFQRQVNLMNIKYRVMFVQSLVLFDIWRLYQRCPVVPGVFWYYWSSRDRSVCHYITFVKSLISTSSPNLAPWNRFASLSHIRFRIRLSREAVAAKTATAIIGHIHFFIHYSHELNRSTYQFLHLVSIHSKPAVWLSAKGNNPMVA